MPSNGYVNNGCLAITLVRNNMGKRLFSVRSVPSLYHPTSDTSCDVLRHWKHTLRIIDSFIYKLTLQSVIPLCHIHTVHNVTRRYNTEHYPCRPTTAKTLITELSLRTASTKTLYKLNCYICNGGDIGLAHTAEKTVSFPYCCERVSLLGNRLHSCC
jgi:hypothetical protein